MDAASPNPTASPGGPQKGSPSRSTGPLTLRELRAALGGAAPDGHPLLPRILDRLDRDLLPRTAGEHEHLVVGIVGPNNAGKSALFNALIGGAVDVGAAAPKRISPSLPTGGATRRLVGALHPALRKVLEGEPTLQRFPMRGVTPGPDGVLVATEAAAPEEVAELLLVEEPSLPETLLLVDTPDFDSVLRENRAVTDALLNVADVAVVVVTRHTYQNHDVIDFLRGWLGHGRPWVLVYNESIDETTTAAHSQKIAEDLGGEPEAIFHAPFDVEVARGQAALVPMPLPGYAGGAPLAGWIRDLGARRDLKKRALEASLDLLRHDLDELATGARQLVHACDGIAEIARDRALVLGRATAREAMPMGPFLKAFREVLDERPTAVQRELRRGLRWTNQQVAGTARWISGKLRGGTGDRPDAVDGSTTLLDVEAREITSRWATFYEPTLIELRGRARADDTPAPLREAAKRMSQGGGSAETLQRATAALALDPETLRKYSEACREIITAELDAKGNEWFLQIAVDALHLLPLGIAGAMIVHTGGLGADVAMAGGGALSSAAAERLSRTLGTGVALSARSRWVDLRGGKIAAAAVDGLLGTDSATLDSLREGAAAIADLSSSRVVV